jgi:hypothetical protein
MTFKELVNEVLIRLREEPISGGWTGDLAESGSGASDYEKLIGALVNDSKRFVEDHHDWVALRETFAITTANGTMQYTLGDNEAGAGTNFKILDVINTATGATLQQARSAWLNQRSFPAANIATGDPSHYGFNGTSSVIATRAKDMNVDLYPVPVSAQVINFNLIKRQDKLTADSDIIDVPSQPVILGAWARAISERGEDGGTQSSMVAQETMESLNTAIMLDSGNTEYEGDWYVG